MESTWNTLEARAVTGHRAEGQAHTQKTPWLAGPPPPRSHGLARPAGWPGRCPVLDHLPSGPRRLMLSGGVVSLSHGPEKANSQDRCDLKTV